MELGALGPPHGRGVLAIGLVLAAALTPVAVGLGELSASAGNTVVAMSLAAVRLNEQDRPYHDSGERQVDQP